jgi:hypothetical protein
MRTIKAIWKYLKGYHLGRKDLSLLDELAANTRVIFLMMIILAAFFFLTDLAGCYESRLDREIFGNLIKCHETKMFFDI